MTDWASDQPIGRRFRGIGSERTIKTRARRGRHGGRGRSPIIKAFIDTVRRMKESGRSK
ncbi:MAG: hypothetical protein ACI9P3_005260 [Bradyrhizobium sp.]|jgi:hypothetical protein